MLRPGTIRVNMRQFREKSGKFITSDSVRHADIIDWTNGCFHTFDATGLLDWLNTTGIFYTFTDDAPYLGVKNVSKNMDE